MVLKHSKACGDFFFFERALKVIQMAHKLLITIQVCEFDLKFDLIYKVILMRIFFIKNNDKAFEMTIIIL